MAPAAGLAVYMVRQRDFKRLLAYSSVEHMGILVFGIGIGGAAVTASLAHVINNAMIGPPSHPRSEIPFPDDFHTGAPIIGFMALVFVMGLYMPAFLVKLLADATAYLESSTELIR